MKKVITTIISVLLAVLLILPVSGAGVVPGDLNGDGEVKAADARLALRFAAKVDTPTAEQIVAADIDGNGKITAADARSILRAAAKLEELPEATSPDDDTLPAPVQAVLDGKVLFIESDADYEGDVYTILLAMSNGNAFYSFSYDELGYSEALLLSKDGSFYEVNTDMMIACNMDAYVEEMYYADTAGFLAFLASLSGDGIKPVITDDYAGSTPCKVYSFISDDYSLRIYISDEELEYVIICDSNMNILFKMASQEYTSDYNDAITVIDNYELLGEEDFYTAIYGEDIFDDGYEDIDWEDTVDWSNATVTEITDVAQVPDEYYLVTSDNYHIAGNSRTTSEDDFFAYGGYLYTYTDMSKHDKSIVISDTVAGMGLSFLIRDNSDGNSEPDIAVYLINTNNMSYTEYDDILAFSLGFDISDFGIESPEDMKLAEYPCEKLEVAEIELDGVVYKKLTFRYEESDFSTSFVFADGKLVRVEECYDDGGTSVVIVDEFSTEVDPAVVSLDGYEEMGSIEFFSNMLLW